MELKKVFIILADISGYTKYIQFHKFDLIHAELIINESKNRTKKWSLLKGTQFLPFISSSRMAVTFPSSIVFITYNHIVI